MKEELLTKGNEPNFEWQLGDEDASLVIRISVKKNWFNRFKWWFSTNVFLPGTYKWDKESDL